MNTQVNSKPARQLGWRRNPALWKWIRRLIWWLACVPFIFQLYGAIFNTLGADPAKELALDTGRWALRFLLLCLAVTPTRELTGIAQLAPLRRTLGLFSLFYASLHLLVYGLFLLELRWFEIGDDILERPYITVGFTAWLILVALGATSPKRMVRLLGQKWRTLHKLVYVAAVLALLHLIWIIRSDISQAVFYGAILIVLLSYRVLNHFKKRAAKAQKNRI